MEPIFSWLQQHAWTVWTSISFSSVAGVIAVVRTLLVTWRVKSRTFVSRKHSSSPRGLRAVFFSVLR